jgi:2-polyprenyl-3-methyl-5-hydroxy-6-metoxy-1,4-benzoquinol methylase
MSGTWRYSVKRTAIALSLLSIMALAATAQAQQTAPAPPLRPPDVIFVPTQDAVAQAMLKMANVTKNDVVYDLGSGDGKLVITAAKLGARAVGIDINPQRIEEANKNAKEAGVTDRVQFILGDIFDPNTKFSDATVVTLYLLPSLNQKLMPRLKGELKPGTRVVSNSFDMGTAWPAEKTEQVGSYTIYMWTIPKQ